MPDNRSIKEQRSMLEVSEEQGAAIEPPCNGG